MRHRYVCFSVAMVLMLSGFILTTRLRKERLNESFPGGGQEEAVWETSGPKLSNGLEKDSSSRKILCRERPEYLKKANIQVKLDPGIVNSVEAMLMFIGYPRSGHTLISSFLDAHPNIVVANEYNILGKWENYTTEHRNKQYLFEELYKNSYAEAREGDRSSEDCLQKTKYNYKIPNQWQGKFDGKIKVVGDKKGGGTTKLLKSSPRYWSMLQNIEREVRVPIKFLHVIRNPFDNIATALLRNRFVYNINWTELYRSPVKITTEKMLKRVDYHMKFAKINADFVQAFGKKVHTLRSEDVIANPQLELRKICEFLNVACSNKYINDAASITSRKISRSRDCVVWDKQAKDLIFRYLQDIPFYRGYQFDE